LTDLVIYVDGSGKGSGAYCFTIPDKHIVRIYSQPEDIPITNNQAEYKSIIEALKFVHEYKKGFKLEDINFKVKIYSDSKVVINQLSYTFAIKNIKLRELALETWKLCEGLEVEFIWIPRKKNKAGKIFG